MRLKLMLLALQLGLTACAPHELYMVMPEADAKVGRVTVSQDGKTTELHGAYSGAEISGWGDADTVNLDAKTVDTYFKTALAAQPLRPTSTMLFFITGTDRWDAASQAKVDAIFNDIKNRPAPEVTVIGHTDTVGKMQDNDLLSMKRAQKVRERLIKLGIPAEHIVAIGRGERDLLIPTADEVNEPRNRRDEISVR